MLKIPDNDNSAVFLNDSFPIMNDCRLGRYKLQIVLIELLDSDKLDIQ